MQNFIGQILDGKYRIEKEIGRGGMGAVYFAVHLGTKRPVAVKVIVPQFMQSVEFVERFKREAEAAGRLRHQNVVNVTDFGFADTKDGQAAYLVMEYLDGCTLGEILQEEKKLPLAWTVDILEQVCSAVEEAHRQGIIHRDLKPDNIWLEPNERGGYTVKVLDFGIAKIQTQSANADSTRSIRLQNQTAETLPAADNENLQTIRHTELEESFKKGYETVKTIGERPIPKPDVTLSLWSKDLAVTELQTVAESPENLHTPEQVVPEKTDPYKKSDDNITRVGAIMGTPLYMSPEQCRGERLGASSDIYSLGIIAYQMLSGKTPFEGEMVSIIAGHLQFPPPPLSAGGVPRRVKKSILKALSKEPLDRQPTAEIFAGQIRSYSDGILKIFRRSLVVFTENFSKLILFSLLLYFPTILLGVLTFIITAAELKGIIPANISTVILGILKFFNIAFTVVAETLVTGAVAWIVVQYIDMPLRSFRVRNALRALLEKWKQFGWILPLRIVVGYFIQGDLTGFSPPTMIFLSFFDTLLFWTLPCVIVIENLSGFALFKRSWKLTLKALPTVLAAIFLNLLVYFVITVSVTIVAYNLTAFVAQQIFPAVYNLPLDQFNKFVEGISLVFIKFTGTVLMPFFAVITALTYLKMRHAGGESIKNLLETFKRSNVPQSDWQKKIHRRLEQSGKFSKSF
ncbi:MAG: protein kinase [Pyrinomonadaceae bacterium]